MKRAVCVIGIALLMGSVAPAQVHIKENVTITPEKPRRPGGLTRTLRFVFAWDTHSMSRLYVPQSPCGGVVQDNPRYGTDSVVIEVPQGYPGDYAFDPQVGVGFVPEGEPVHATFSIYINDTMVQHDSTVLFGSGSELYSPWPNGWIYYNPPWFSQFNFELSAKTIPYSTDTHPIISGMNDCGGTSWSPLDQMTLTIESGIGYASFYGYDLSNGTYDIPFGNKAEGTGADIAGNILLSATGTVPGKDGQWVTVKASSNGIVKVDSTLVTPPPDLDHFTVQLQPDTIAFSGQSRIVVQAKDINGVDFSLTGDVTISVSPGGYGTLSTIMPGIPGEIRGTKPSAVHDVKHADKAGRKMFQLSDDETVVPYSSANSGWMFFRADGAVPESTVTLTFTVASVDQPGAIGTGTLVIERHTILLGETKYYYATDNNGTLIIHETTDPSTNPGLGTVIPKDPVVAEGSEKNPVYWDKLGPKDKGLPDGMIRLIGRFWEDGKTYKTTLEFYNPDDAADASIDITVKKPSSLGSRYSNSKDVFDNRIDIDSICIKYAGIYGIPPQFIKGQMEEEAATFDFGGDIGSGFAPSYRYEPYTAQFDGWVRNRTSNPFYVTLSNVDNPPVPDHKYVQLIPYIYPNKYVWDVISDHSQLVNNVADDSHRLYGIRTYADTMNFLPYRRIQSYYSNFLQQALQKYELSDAATKANAEMVAFFRDQWDGGVKDGTKGLKNILAQTRIASSYGLLQMLYKTAVKRHYQEGISHLPENLNVTTTIMDLSIQYQKSLLEDGIGASVESGGNWPEGFERGFYDFVYANWNTKATYNDEIFQKSTNYLPQP